ncbi:hypothetical protein K440DRAFT_560961 [Wilcoxina mikolae CBS 423.85]|nr:hypothetical protein K440DRAFT_560961 [Wilcoxina mikolae CBS 423.85]
MSELESHRLIHSHPHPNKFEISQSIFSLATPILHHPHTYHPIFPVISLSSSYHQTPKTPQQKIAAKNYGTRDSRMVTHCSTNLAMLCLDMAERTGSLVFITL